MTAPMTATWVLIRGLSREAAHWGPFPAELSRALGDAPVIAVDLPGAGRLWRQPSPLRVRDMVEGCRAQLHAQTLPPPYALLGLSLGGMVAAAWSAAHPQEVAACVLVNSSMRPFSAAHQRLRAGHWPALLRLLGSRDEVAIEQRILALTSRQPARHAAVLNAWLSIRRLRPVAAVNVVRQLLAAAAYRYMGDAPPMPTLVIASAMDGLVDPACSRAIARHWGAELIEHPSAGHDLPLDDGPWLAQRLAGWHLSQQSLDGAAPR